MPSFEFATANRIIFGAGRLHELKNQLEAGAKRVLLVRGKSSDAIPRVREILSAQEIPFKEFSLHGEPTMDTVTEGAQFALQHDCNLVIGLGGGSVLDAGKAIAALATNRRDIFDYLEIVGKGQPLTEKPLPYMAIPTTSGTGSEVTRNAVLESPAHGLKVSLRSPLMLPDIALVDPELTYGLPPAVTASSGLDALTQLIEPFVSVKANPMTDAICREGIHHAARSLRTAYQNGADISAREDMALASLFGGLALANAALGAVHGFAGPLGGMLHAPHGAICAKLLPLVMAANLKALQTRHAGHIAIERYTEIAQLLHGNKNATAQDGIQSVKELVNDLHIPSLSSYGMTKSQIPELVQKTLNTSSYKGNPIALNKEELANVLEQAL
jgi:alcohol dehydrogenase class IV